MLTRKRGKNEEEDEFLEDFILLLDAEDFILLVDEEEKGKLLDSFSTSRISPFASLSTHRRRIEPSVQKRRTNTLTTPLPR